MRARQRRAQAATGAGDPDLRAHRHRWAELIRRIYEVDPLVCPRCGAAMRILAFITERKVIRTILSRLAVTGANGRNPPETPHNHRPAA